MSGRRRVAAVIVRDGCVLMVRERGEGPASRHDGPEYWTLPGGGLEDGEDPLDAVRREVAEETGLRAVSVRYAYEAPYPSGRTACFRVEVAPGEPVLGVDPDPECDCPRMVGLIWVPLSRGPDGGSAVGGGADGGSAVGAGTDGGGTVGAGDTVMVPTLLQAARV
ncbi:NUDIX domain-containing protein [Streptomyces sp. NPDC058619]|uniref:NUDIX domain-containing protein n=1 Tax=unclassified Streptomyces TaxID=2593676 RepID=UPI00364FA337